MNEPVIRGGSNSARPAAQFVSSVLWQSSQRPMCCLKLQHNRFVIIDINPAMVDWLAMSIKELINQPLHDVLLSVADQTHYYSKALETGQSVIFEDSVRSINCDYWLSIEAIPIEAEQLLVTLTDITDSKHTEEQPNHRSVNHPIAKEQRTYQETEAALRQSEERFRSLFEGTSLIGMQIYNTERRVIDWNQASEEIYGYSREEAIGKRLEDLIIPGSMREAVIQAIDDWITQDIPIPASELTLRHKNGGPVDVFSSHVMLTNAQGEKELYCLDLDIRDRKHAEKTLQQAQLNMLHAEKMASLGKMVAGITHEINNPISFIVGNLSHANEYIQDLLRLTTLYQTVYPQPEPAIQTALQEIELDFISQDFPKLSTSIQVGAERIQQIVDSLKHFARLGETGAKVVDIHAALNNTLRLLNHRLEKTDPPIRILRTYGERNSTVGYPGPLNQVFMHILNNAIDALIEKQTDCQYHEPWINVSTQQLDNQIVITISDNGPGIAPQIKEKIFDPFITTKPVGHGTGMGLAICYQIITQQHHGHLLVESEPEVGTCFKIHLPLMVSLTP